MARFRRHLTYANVMSSIAAFAAIGGVSYAAATLPKNSVTSNAIRNGQVKSADLAKNAVISSKVKNGSLLAADFKAGQLPAGAKGDKGDKGDTGARGPSDGFVFRKDGDVIPADPGATSKVVGSLQLPAGRYVLNAKALVGANTQAGFIDCVLTQASTTIDQAQFYLPAGSGAGAPSDEMAVLAGGIDLPGGGLVQLTCQRANAQTLGVFVDDIRIVATQVETLTQSTS